MTLKREAIGKGAAYIYVETIASMFSGYLFWIVMSKMASVEVIGSASALISITGIIVSIAGLGIPTGVQRFLAKSISENNFRHTQLYVNCSVLLSTFATVCSIVVIFTLWKAGLDILDLSIGLFVLATVLVSTSVLSILFRGIIISAIKTRVLVKTMLITSIIKIALSAILVAAGLGLTGLLIGFTSYSLVSSVILGYFIIQNLSGGAKYRVSLSERINGLLSASNTTLRASIPFWVPFFVTTIGSQLGIIVVFGAGGAENAGVFFMSQTIVIGITSVMYSLFTVIIPTLNAMDDGRKRVAWNAIRISLIIAQPLAGALVFYSGDILGLLGESYARASSLLSIMLFSLVPTLIQFGVTALVFSYGQHRNVLFLGLAVSLPRVILYFVFVPLYGATGAAIAFTLGAVIGLAATYLVSRLVGFKMNSKLVLIIFTVPLIVGALVDLVVSNYIIGIFSIMIASYLIYYKVKVISAMDINNSIRILPAYVSIPLSKFLSTISQKKRRDLK